MLRTLIIVLLVGLTSGNLYATTLEHFNSILQPAAAKSDIDQWLAFIEKTHPDLAYTVKDVPLFYSQVSQFKNSINKPVSVREFWLEMMKFNRVVSDGHVSLTPPKKVEITQQYLKNGGTLFPFEVLFDNGQLIIKGKLNGKTSKLTGNVVTKINGTPIETILAPLLERTHGDSDNQRRAVLATRFAIYYWMYFGEQKQFTLDIKKGTHELHDITVKASKEMAINDDSFASKFQFNVINDNTALLTINTFTWREDEARVFKFFEAAFTEIKDKKLTHLIIDIRKNGGGDDNIWMKGILPYIADKPWRTGSNYEVKILAGREDEGETAGDVVKGEISSIHQVDSENALKFTGEVSVLVGPYTYSSSILFVNVMQDYEFGKLVGDSTGGKSGQTGGTQKQILSHSKLKTISPRFWLTRPKGGHNQELVILDTIINYDQTQPQQLVDKVVASHRH